MALLPAAALEAALVMEAAALVTDEAALVEAGAAAADDEPALAAAPPPQADNNPAVAILKLLPANSRKTARREGDTTTSLSSAQHYYRPRLSMPPVPPKPEADNRRRGDSGMSTDTRYCYDSKGGLDAQTFRPNYAHATAHVFFTES